LDAGSLGLRLCPRPGSPQDWLDGRRYGGSLARRTSRSFRLKSSALMASLGRPYLRAADTSREYLHHVAGEFDSCWRKLRCLRLAGHAHALHGVGWECGVPNRFPRALAAARAAVVSSEIAAQVGLDLVSQRACQLFLSHPPRPHCAPTTPKQHGRPAPAPTA